MSRLFRRGYLCVVYSVVCLFVLAGCNNSSSQAHTASTTKSVSITMFAADAVSAACVGTFTDAAHVYRIDCPRGWVVTTDTLVPDGVALVSPTRAAGLIISANNGATPASQYTASLQHYLDRVGATEVHITQQDQQVTAGANTWTMQKANFTRSGTNFTVAQYATVHNGKTIYVQAVAPTANFNTAQSTFQSTLASLKFA